MSTWSAIFPNWRWMILAVALITRLNFIIFYSINFRPIKQVLIFRSFIIILLILISILIFLVSKNSIVASSLSYRDYEVINSIPLKLEVCSNDIFLGVGDIPPVTGNMFVEDWVRIFHELAKKDFIIAYSIRAATLNHYELSFVSITNFISCLETTSGISFIKDGLGIITLDGAINFLKSNFTEELTLQKDLWKINKKIGDGANLWGLHFIKDSPSTITCLTELGERLSKVSLEEREKAVLILEDFKSRQVFKDFPIYLESKEDFIVIEFRDFRHKRNLKNCILNIREIDMKLSQISLMLANKWGIRIGSSTSAFGRTLEAKMILDNLLLNDFNKIFGEINLYNPELAKGLIKEYSKPYTTGLLRLLNEWHLEVGAHSELSAKISSQSPNFSKLDYYTFLKHPGWVPLDFFLSHKSSCPNINDSIKGLEIFQDTVNCYSIKPRLRDIQRFPTNSVGS